MYHHFTLIKVKGGVIFKAFGSLEIYHFKTDDQSWT